MNTTQMLSDQEVEIAKEAWSAGYEAAKADSAHEIAELKEINMELQFQINLFCKEIDRLNEREDKFQDKFQDKFKEQS